MHFRHHKPANHVGLGFSPDALEMSGMVENVGAEAPTHMFLSTMSKMRERSRACLRICKGFAFSKTMRQ
jgi:hypothetical protein